MELEIEGICSELIRNPSWGYKVMGVGGVGGALCAILFNAFSHLDLPHTFRESPFRLRLRDRSFPPPPPYVLDAPRPPPTALVAHRKDAQLQLLESTLQQVRAEHLLQRGGGGGGFTHRSSLSQNGTLLEVLVLNIHAR